MKLKFLAAALAIAAPSLVQAQSWEPTKNVEFIIPAGTGGGADQMARAIQGVAKHGLMKQSILPINKAGGAGAEGFLDVERVRRSAQDHHHAVESLHHACHRVPFNWSHAGADAGARQLRAVGERQDAVPEPQGVHRGGEEARTGKMKMGGTGAKQEDQIITVAIEQKDRRQVHGASVQGRRHRGERSSSAATLTRRSTTRSRRWRNGAPGL